MRVILGSRRRHYVARVGIFLIALALTAGMVSCNGSGGESYTLTIASTAGGTVDTPGMGTFTYSAGRVVNLVATADTGYQFGNWTGDVGTVANVKAAPTTITLNGNYSITANFEIEGESSPGHPVTP